MDFATVLLETLRTQVKGAAAAATEDVLPWMQSTFGALMVLAEPIRRMHVACQVVNQDKDTGVVGPCHRTSSVRCSACARYSCLNHAMINNLGESICFHCAAEVFRAKANRTSPNAGQSQQHTGPRPVDRTAAIDAAFKTLGCTRGMTLEQVKAKFKELALKHHPDRAKNEQERLKKTEKFKAISAAWELLRDHAFIKEPA